MEYFTFQPEFEMFLDEFEMLFEMFGQNKCHQGTSEVAKGLESIVKTLFTHMVAERMVEVNLFSAMLSTS